MTTSHRPPKPAPVQPSIEDSLDRLTVNRRVAIPLAKSIPSPGPGYVPLSSEGKQRLRKIADDLRSEAHGALAQITANHDRFRPDLGELVPDAALAAPLAARLIAVEEAMTNAEALIQFMRDMEMIAVNDVIEYLEAVNDELQHRLPKRPQLATAYSKLRTLFEMRSSAMSEGRVRARKNATRERVAPGAEPASPPEA